MGARPLGTVLSNADTDGCRKLSGEQRAFSGELAQQARDEDVCSTGNRAKAAPDRHETSLLVFQADQQLIRRVKVTLDVRSVEGTRQ